MVRAGEIYSLLDRLIIGSENLIDSLIFWGRGVNKRNWS